MIDINATAKKAPILGVALMIWTLASAGLLRAEEMTRNINGLTALATVTTTDGENLKGNPAVLMVHGTLAHKDMDIMMQQRELLAERGYNTLAISLTLGLEGRRGLYDCGVPHTHSHEDALTEIGNWVDWLEAEGANPIILMGHSRGGAQAALYMADTQDPRVAALILAAPMTHDPSKVAESYKTRHGRDLDQALAEVKGADADQMLKGFGVLYCPGADVTAASFMSYYGAGEDRRDTPTIMQRISGPVLVTIAADDQAVPDLPARIENRAPKGASIVIIDEAGHMFLDFAGEDLADAIDAFIQDRVMAKQGG